MYINILKKRTNNIEKNIKIGDVNEINKKGLYKKINR